MSKQLTLERAEEASWSALRHHLCKRIVSKWRVVVTGSWEKHYDPSSIAGDYRQLIFNCQVEGGWHAEASTVLDYLFSGEVPLPKGRYIVNVQTTHNSVVTETTSSSERYSNGDAFAKYTGASTPIFKEYDAFAAPPPLLWKPIEDTSKLSDHEFALEMARRRGTAPRPVESPGEPVRPSPYKPMTKAWADEWAAESKKRGYTDPYDDGTAAKPSIGFASDPSTGFYRGRTDDDR